MTFTLRFTQRAVKDIEQLDTLVKKRLAKKILALQDDPIGKSKKLLNPKLGSYRYRIGDYRVIFDIAGSDIVILRVGHRKEIYR